MCLLLFLLTFRVLVSCHRLSYYRFNSSVNRVCQACTLLLNIHCLLDWIVTVCLAVLSFSGVVFWDKVLDFPKVVPEGVSEGSL